MVKIISIETQSRIQAKDITAIIKKEIKNSGIQDGLCSIFIPHTTAGIFINEHCDPDVVDDIMTTLSEIAPYNRRYNHIEGNSDAHIKSTLIGASVVIPGSSPF